MNRNTKFNNLSLDNECLFLNLKNGDKINISFSELNKAYIKVSKFQPLYQFSIVSVLFFLVFFSVNFVAIEPISFLAFILVIPIFLKIKKHQSFSFVIQLHDGSLFSKKVPLNRKEEHRLMVSKLRNEILKCTSTPKPSTLTTPAVYLIDPSAIEVDYTILLVG